MSHKAAVPTLVALNLLVRANDVTLHHRLVAVVLTENRANPPVLVLQHAVRANLMDHAHRLVDHNPVANHHTAAILDRHDIRKNSADHDSWNDSPTDLKAINHRRGDLNPVDSHLAAAILDRNDIPKNSADHDSQNDNPADLKAGRHGRGDLNPVANHPTEAISDRHDIRKDSVDHDSRNGSLADLKDVDHRRGDLNLVVDHSPGDPDLALKRFSLLVEVAMPVVSLCCKAEPTEAPSINSMRTPMEKSRKTKRCRRLLKPMPMATERSAVKNSSK